MKPDNWISLGSAIATAILTCVGLYLGPRIAVKRALEQFRQQKWWEKKEAIYTSLLQDLSLLNQQGLAALDLIQQGGTYRASDHDREISRKARQRIKESIELGSYLISEEAGKALQKVEWSDGDDAMLYFDNFTDKNLSAAIKILRKEASLEVPPTKSH